MSQSKTREVADKVAEITDRVGRPHNIEAVEVELVGGGNHRVLRIFIDKPEGVTHTDCEFITHEVGAVLDAEDLIPGGAYTLEVSSPGVERKLVKPTDYERFRGKKIKVALREPVEKQRRWEGTLAGLAEGIVTLEHASGKTVRFPLEQVEKANLKFEW